LRMGVPIDERRNRIAVGADELQGAQLLIEEEWRSAAGANLQAAQRRGQARIGDRRNHGCGRQGLGRGGGGGGPPHLALHELEIMWNLAVDKLRLTPQPKRVGRLVVVSAAEDYRV